MPLRVRWLLRGAIALAVPLIPCSAYYSLAYVDAAQGPWLLPVVLAGPLVLIGCIVLVSALLEARSARRKLWLAGVMIVAPMVLLVWIRL
jgi:hypothetical protein